MKLLPILLVLVLVSYVQCSGLQQLGHTTQGAIVQALWASQGNAFLLTTANYVYMYDAAKEVFRNIVTDGGLEGAMTYGGVVAIYQSPADPKYVLFVGKGTTQWVTKDAGATFKKIVLSHPIRKVDLSPINPNEIAYTHDSVSGCFATTSKECSIVLEYSSDFGESSTVVSKYVERFEWWSSSIIYIEHRTKSGKQRVHYGNEVAENIGCYRDDTYDFVSFSLVSKANSVLAKDTSDFIVFEDADYAMACQPTSDHRYVTVDLSTKSVHVLRGQGEDISMQHIQVINSNLYAQALAYVRVSALRSVSAEVFKTGSLMWSTSDGASLVLALSNVAEDKQGHMEVFVPKDIPGVLFANAGSSLLKVKHTMISRDFGRTWNLLAVPSGYNNTCVDGKGEYDKCGLQLQLSLNYGWSGGMVSGGGYILVQGHVGKTVTSDPSLISTWISKDGGLSFEEIISDPLFSAVTETGALVSANSEVMTEEILVSVNGGDAWVTHGTGALQGVEGLTPSLAGRSVVLIWGGSSVMAAGLDPLFERDCNSNDYEEMYHLGKLCVNGEIQKLRRRTPSVPCRSKVAPSVVHGAKCACSHADFECNSILGAEMPDTHGFICKAGALWPANFSDVCKGDVLTYRVPSYYNMRRDNVCNAKAPGAVVHQDTTTDCAQGLAPKGPGAIVWAFFALILVGLGVFFGLRYTNNCTKKPSFISNWSRVREPEAEEYEGLTGATAGGGSGADVSDEDGEEETVIKLGDVDEYDDDESWLHDKEETSTHTTSASEEQPNVEETVLSFHEPSALPAANLRDFALPPPPVKSTSQPQNILDSLI